MNNQTPYQSPYQLPAGNQQPDNSSVAIQPQQSQPQQQPQQQQPQESWWKKLLPVAGAVGGGLLGEVVDPFGGGIFGSALGASLFGGAGQAVGKVGENIASGQSAGKDVLSNALQGVAFGGIGGGIGGGLEKLGGSVAEKGAASVLKTSDARTQAATKLANSNKQAASELNYKGIGETLADKYKLGKNQQFVDSLGFASHNPYDMQKVSKGGYELNKVYDNALQTGTADMSNFSNDTYNAIKNSGVQDLNSSPVGRALSDYGINVGDSLSKNMPLTEVRKLQQSIGKEMSNQENIINNAELNGSYNQEAVANHSSLEKIYNDLGTKIKTPEVNKSIESTTLTPEERTALVSQHGEQHGNLLADTINNAKNADDLLKPMQSYTQMGKASDKAINDIENVTNSSRATARATASAEGNPGVALPDQPPEDNLLQHALNAVVTAAGGGNKIGKAAQLAGIAQKSGIIPKGMEKTGSLLERIGKVAGPSALGAGSLAGALSTGGPAGGAQQPIQQGVNMQQQPNPLQNEMNMMMMQSILAPSSLGTSANATMQTILPTLLKQAQAQSQLTALQQQLAGAGGGQGFGGNGIFNQLASHLPFTQQAAALNQVKNLGNQLGINPNINFMQNQQTQQNQLGALQNAVSGLGLGQQSMPLGQ